MHTEFVVANLATKVMQKIIYVISSLYYYITII